MGAYIVDAASQIKADIPGKKPGLTFQVIKLWLRDGEGQAATEAEWFTPQSTELPAPGSTLQGELTLGDYGFNFRVLGRPRIKRRYVVDPDSGCWVWQNARQSNGYGVTSWDDGERVLAHRFFYVQAHGPIPDGLHLDHLCRNPACVNPTHLEAVTCRENLLRGVGPSAQNARKTHCPQGHEYTPENTAVRRGQRECRECNRERARQNARKKRAMV